MSKLEQRIRRQVQEAERRESLNDRRVSRWERRLPLVPLNVAIKKAKRLNVKKLRKQLAALEDLKKVSQKTMMTSFDI